MSVIGRLFREILDRTGIAEQTDKNVTLYSLRHTAIMMRLVKGNVNTSASCKKRKNISTDD
jgi:hypothetical protein